MSLLHGKKGVVMGVANDHSIAWGISKKLSNELLNNIKGNKVDILIGTQMISKGFNFPKLNCIVVIDADFSGRGYDLRTTEKNIQLYHQLSGRAGRFSSESLIIYQTLTPHNNTLNELIKKLDAKSSRRVLSGAVSPKSCNATRLRTLLVCAFRFVTHTSIRVICTAVLI